MIPIIPYSHYFWVGGPLKEYVIPLAQGSRFTQSQKRLAHLTPWRHADGGGSGACSAGDSGSRVQTLFLGVAYPKPLNPQP